ncbi:MAG: flippase [Candidatus Doudnabacteria bacterium]|nr:flippase [Candidatus Doudnabacteria bacterium]
MLQIGRNIFSLVFSRVIAGIILFLIYAQLAQYLGPVKAGQYGLLAGFITVFSIFVDLGMSQLVIKKISEDRARASKILANYFSIQFLLGVGFMLIMAGYIFTTDYPQIVKNALYITSVALLLSSMSLPFRSVINAFQKLTIIAQVNFVNSVINGGMMILAIYFRTDIFFLAFISIAVSVFDLLIYGIVTHKKFTPFRIEFDKSFVKQLFIWTFPFTLLTFFSIYNRIDALMLPQLRDFRETGYYAAAYKFWDVLAFFPAVIAISLYPFFAEALSRNLRDQAKKGLETYTRYMIAIALPLAAGAFLVSGELINIFYGADFAPAAPAMWILIAAVAVLFIYTPVNSMIISQETKAATKITGFTLLFNFTTNLIFIPIFGFVAAAVTTVASELIQLFGYTWVIKRRVVQFQFFRHFIKPIAAVVVMAGAVVYLKPLLQLWLVIGLAGVIYAMALYLLKFFNREDWELFKAAVNVRKQVDTERDVIT